MKSFSFFMADLNNGQTNAALTAHLGELLGAVKAHGRPGTLKLNIRIAPVVKGNSGADSIQVVVDSQLALPKPQQPVDFFYMTDDGEPTRLHPRQTTLELHEVAPVRIFNNPDADGVLTMKETLK